MNIKMMIFDQDGTLYPNGHKLFQYTRVKTKEWLSNKLKLSLEEIEKIYKTLPSKYPNPYLGFISLGCSVEEYMSEVFDKINPSSFLTFNPRLYEYFLNNKFFKALVTLASRQYTEKLQETLKLKELFDEILYLEDFKIYNKSECYKKLSKDFNIDFSEMCIIGDSYENDIIPAQQLGCKTVLISSVKKNIDDVIVVKSIEDFINLKIGEK